VAGDPYRGSHATIDTKDLAIRAGSGADSIQVGQLADWIIQGRNDFKLVDLRSGTDFAAYHIPTAENVPLASLTPDFAAHNEKVILCSEDGTQAAKAWFLLEAQGFKSVYLLDGGLRSWQDMILFPKKSDKTDEAVFDRQVQVAKFFGGTPQMGGAAAPTATAVALPKLAMPILPASSDAGASKSQPKKKKEGC
jgi:rhodanese-related sulfurtransferase